MSMTDLSPAAPFSPRTPQQVVDEITSAAKSSFSLGMKLLSRPRRQAMRAVYAFCRVVDDIADGDLPVRERIELLSDWRQEVDRIFAGTPSSAIGQALLRPIAEYALPKSEFLLMIEGMEMDARGPIVAPSMEELAAYTRRVAGSVGCLSMRIFGAWRGDESERFALALADAIQQTNILRDVEEDARIGRLYLPREVLDEAGIPADPPRVPGHPNLPKACGMLGLAARENFSAARALAPRHCRQALMPAMAMMGVYRRYLKLMESRDFCRDAPVRLSKAAKLLSGLGAVLLPQRA